MQNVVIRGLSRAGRWPSHSAHLTSRSYLDLTGCRSAGVATQWARLAHEGSMDGAVALPLDMCEMVHYNTACLATKQRNDVVVFRTINEDRS